MSSDQNDPPKSQETPENTGGELLPESAISLLAQMLNSKSAREGRRNLGEASAHLGMIPIVPDKRDLDSADRAFKIALSLFDAEGIDSKKLNWLKYELVNLSQRYWVEFERDARSTFSDMKTEVAQFQKHLVKVIKHLGELSPAAREALERNALALKGNDLASNRVEELKHNAELLHDACLPISKEKHSKPRRSFRFERCSADLWAVREKITGKAIPRNFELSENAFTTTDAAFIAAVMKAIDNKVTPSQVQGGLQRAAQAKKPRK